MSQKTAIRRRKQARNGYRHLAMLHRSIYKRRVSLSVHDAIAVERARAIREANRKAKK